MRGFVLAVAALTLTGSRPSTSDSSRAVAAYAWTQVTDSAAYPGAYNFPVFAVGRQMWALHPQGNWYSTDGKAWVRSSLPLSGLNAGYQRYVAFHDAVYALGTMTGNYLDLHLTTRIARTHDFRKWEVVAAESNLPHRVFYGAVAYNDHLWLMGGFDGVTYHNDVWTSTDGAHWTQIAEHAGWSPRDVDLAVVFKDRIWVIGGGMIDGQREINPNSKREAWSSTDGVHWEKARDREGPAWGGTPAVFDGKLWLIGANRNSTFAPSTLVTDDGSTWREESAPWSPRGAPAVWVRDDTLYMTGGKYSVMENGAPRFIYRNDVWSLTKRRR